MHQPNTPSDADLLHDFATARSEPAFRALADRHAPWLFASALRQLHDRHLAEDAAQAVFLLLAQKAHAMSDAQKRNLPGWLFNTLHYTLRNLRRAHRARQKHEQQIAQQLPPQFDTTQPADPAEAALLANTLDAAVAKLSTPDRTAILLRFYQNRPIDDIAHTLNISEPAARKRLTRAIAKLRHHLTRKNPAAVGGQSANTFNSATLTLAASHGLQSAPATLPATIAHLAASSSALPVTLAATIKGASTLMATAKLQTAFISTALALAIFIPTTLITIHLVTRPSTSVPSALPSPTPPLADSPARAPAPDAEPTYALAPNQIIALIPPPYPDSRHDIVDRIHQSRQQPRANATTLPASVALTNSGSMQFQVTGKGTAQLVQSGGGGRGGGGIGTISANGQSFHFTPNNNDPDAMILLSHDNLPLSLSSERDSTKGNNFFTIHDLLQSLFNLSPDLVEGQRYLLDRKIPGDFLVRANVPPDQLRPALEKLLSEQLDVPLTLTFHDIPTTTYELAGTWKTNPDGSLPTLHLYTDDNSDDTNVGNGMLSPANAIVTALTRLLHAPVTINTTNTPRSLTYITHRMPPNPDPATLLAHLTEQTGLTWSKQSHPLRHISIETKN